MKEKHVHSSLFPSELVADRNVSLDNRSDGQLGTKRSIGTILVDAGVLTVENAYRIIEFQRKNKIRLAKPRRR